MDISYDKSELIAVAEKCWKKNSRFRVWALHGPMGVGKTTFVQALCKNILHSPDNTSSPTFALIQQYSSPVTGSICHIDLYRLGDEEEAIQAGVEDAMETAGLSLVEWPDIAPGLFPEEETVHLYFEQQDNGLRRLVTRSVPQTINHSI